MKYSINKFLVCSGCKKSVDQVTDKVIFHVDGNITATCANSTHGGIIGNNIARGNKEIWEHPPFDIRQLIYKSKHLRLYSMSYCKDCLIEAISRTNRR